MRQSFQFQPRNVPPFPQFAQPPFMNPQWPQPPPMMIMPMPQFIQQQPMIPQPMPKPETPGTQQVANPFVPLQASRKATKAKNGNDSNQQESNTTDKNPTKHSNDKKQEKFDVSSTAVVTPTTENAAKSKTPTVDNRKSRLAINFTAN